VRCVADFRAVMEEFAQFGPHLVLLDLGLPYCNGYHWCDEIRRVSRTPVVFLSSASEKMNIVMAINRGGDDFIAKPFDLDVLAAKVQAILRRSYDFSGQSEALSWGGAVLDTDSATLRCGGRRLELTKNEYRILQVLMEGRGRCVSRERLMERLWDTDCYVDDNTLTVNMTRLRHKLKEMGLSGMIVTKKGMGYRLADPGEAPREDRQGG